MEDDNVVQQARYVLADALARIDTPDKWTTGVSARDAEGRCVSIKSPCAHKYCATGAIFAGDDDDHRARVAALDAIIDYAGIPLDHPYPFTQFAKESKIMVWNDAEGRTHSEVVRVFEAAIEGGGWKQLKLKGFDYE